MSEQITPPPAVEALRQQVVCPRCGSKRAPAGKVIVLVSRKAPDLWLLVGRCFECDLSGFWSLVQVNAETDEGYVGPARERTGEDVPLPEGFKGLLS